jgi:putative ABC transport system permease protein
MIRLLNIWSFSHFKLLKSNTVLTLMGISLGVAIFTAVQTANQNIQDSFRWTIYQIAGKGDLEIRGGEAGFPEGSIVQARKLPGVREAMPETIQSVSVQNGAEPEEVMVLGLDFLQDSRFHNYTVDQAGPPAPFDFLSLLEPDAVVLSDFLAKRLHLKVGSPFIFKIGRERISSHVAGILRYSDDLPPPFGGFFALMDIASSQLLFHKLGRLDGITLLREEGVSEGDLEAEVQRALPGLLVQSPDQKNRMIDSMLGSFNLNLKALSAISVLVGMFLIYNTLSILVVRRKIEIGILRSIGLSGKEVFFLVLLEALLLGAVGTTLGIALGFLISGAVLKAISLTITSLYLKVFAREVYLPFWVGLESYAIGLGVSLLAASFPAWEASKILPGNNLVRQGERVRPVFNKQLLGAGGICLILSIGLAYLPPVFGKPLFGYLSALFLLLGLSLMIPSLIFILNRVLDLPLFRNRMVFLKVAGGGFFRQPARNSIGIATLMMSVALLISVTLMIHSFRKTLNAWFSQTIKADLVVEPAGWLSPGPLSQVSPEFGEKINKIKGVAAVDLFREDHLLYRNEPYLLNSRNLSIHREYSRYLLTAGEPKKILQKVISESGVLISERFSLQHHLRPGDLLVLDTPSGPASFRIVGVFYDYTTQGGKVVMDRLLYLKYWKDPEVNLLAVYLEKNKIPEGTEEEIRKKISIVIRGKGLFVISNREIKLKVMEIFDQTFSVTRALEWITILISLLGVINMLLANLLDQKREIGILRSLGATRHQIGTLTLYEAVWVTLIANLVGAAGGLGLSLILIYVINRQSFLWSIQFDFSGMVFLRTFLLVTSAALLAGYFPAKEAAKGNIAESVHYE